MTAQPRVAGPLLSVADAADYLGISEGTLRNWLSMRRIDYVKVGSLTKLRKDTLDRYIKENTIEAKRRTESLTGDQDIRRAPAPKLSVHVAAYTEWTQARNSTAGKDPDVLARFLAVVGDKRLDKVTTFDVEKWKTQRAKQVKKSTVNRELNIVRGCFSRAVDWDLLSKSPLARVKP